MPDDACPHCGAVYPDDHQEDCPTCGTCAQTQPELPRPWHTDEEWLGDERFTIERLDEHFRTAHPDWKLRY